MVKQMVDNIKIGIFIKEQRRKKNLSQSALAEKMLVSREAVSKWENGHNLPDVSIMSRLAEILDVTVDELLAGEKTLVSANDIVPEPKHKLLWILIPAAVLVVLLFMLFMPHYLNSNVSLNINQEAVYLPESEQEIGRIYYFEYDHEQLKWDEIETAEIVIDDKHVLLFSLKQKLLSNDRVSDFEVLNYVKYSQSEPFDVVIYYPGNISSLINITDYDILIDNVNKKAEAIVCEFSSRP